VKGTDRRYPEIHGSDPDQPALRIYTLGGFSVWRAREPVEHTAWGREKAVHLFQFFVTNRGQLLHKEQIIDQLWPESPVDAGDRDFKVALNAINRAIEPERAPRAKPRFIERVDLTYGLNTDQTWVDVEAFESHLVRGNRLFKENETAAIGHYQAALALYQGEYLPERRYEDWTSAERERLGIMALSAMTTMAGFEVEHEPREALRLTQQVLSIEPLWEEAYRTQMRAFQVLGNRPMALRTYQKCITVLREALSIDPLPETQLLCQEIRQAR
jgi:two-component SAPR family response regulator